MHVDSLQDWPNDIPRPKSLREHWPFWRKFIRAEKDVGGPDCQFTLMLEHARIHNQLVYKNPTHDRDRLDTVWLLGCYAAHHVAPSAHAVFEHFTVEEGASKPKRLRRWLEEHWDALPVRREMRSHRMVEKRLTCLQDAARYALSGKWEQGTYDDLWDDTQRSIKYFGRYMAIKYLELLRRTVRPDVKPYDTRARHAWSPRACMALLYPEHRSWLADRNRNDAKTIERVEKYATKIYKDLREHGIKVSYFELQGLLCNYKEMLYGRFYPGAGHDEELFYLKQFGTKFKVRPWLQTRSQIFPHKYLGERGDPKWLGIREEVGQRWLEKAAHLHKPKGATGGYGI